MQNNFEQIQNDLLSQFIKLHNYPSLKQISKMTGIQETRVFRILKGHELKLHEYLLLKHLMDQKHLHVLSLVETIENYKEKLAPNLFIKLQNELEREIRFQKLINYDAA